MTEKVTKLTREDLAEVITAQEGILEVQKALEVARLRAQVALQQVYIVKKLDMQCQVDLKTGSVIWPKTEEEKAAEVLKEAAEEGVPEVEATVVPGFKKA